MWLAFVCVSGCKRYRLNHREALREHIDVPTHDPEMQLAGPCNVGPTGISVTTACKPVLPSRWERLKDAEGRRRSTVLQS